MTRRAGDMSSPEVRKKRRKAWEQQEGICWLCREALPWEEATLDHVLPLSVGGGNAQGNLRAAHGKCNNDRHREEQLGVSKEERHARAMLAWEKGWRRRKPKPFTSGNQAREKTPSSSEGTE